MVETLVLLGAALLAAGGLPGLFLPRRSGAGPAASAVLSTAGAAAGLTGAALVLAGGGGTGLDLPWAVPGGRLLLRVDALSAFFLCPVFLVSALGSVYGLGYWSPAERPEDAARLRAFYGALGACLALLLSARNGVIFLAAWEGMALAAFFLIATDDRDPEVRGAAWVYLVATHAGTLALLGLFAWVGALTGSLDFPGRLALAPGAAAGVFVLALLGFGLKAGFLPLHVWLPGAHANAPSHVSAILSGVVIKMGIYGLLRVTSWFPQPPAWWGWTVLALGAASAVLGVAYALGQHDLKRLLAYHSVENIGIIGLGLGLALLGRAAGRPEWVALGLAGGLLHVWNHGLFKSLLFLAAGSAIHAAGTREMDALGGLARPMPCTALAFLVGAVAICGLPPLNGFASELLIYLGLFRTAAPGTGAAAAAALAAPALALVGALALACFVKAFGAVFLGEPRSGRARGVHGEAPASMTGPMALLVLLCAAIGLAPWAVAPALDRAVAAWDGTEGAVPAVGSLAPLPALTGLGLGLLGLLAVGALLLRRSLARRPAEAGVTWDCGYAAPTARMQYTASSFARTLVGLFAWALRPEEHAPGVAGPFPAATRFGSHVPDAVLHRLLLPASRVGAEWLGRLRTLQQGRIQAYVAYVLAALIALLAWR